MTESNNFDWNAFAHLVGKYWKDISRSHKPKLINTLYRHYKSIYKVEAASGIPKSVVHRWLTRHQQAGRFYRKTLIDIHALLKAIDKAFSKQSSSTADPVHNATLPSFKGMRRNIKEE